MCHLCSNQSTNIGRFVRIKSLEKGSAFLDIVLYIGNSGDGIQNLLLIHTFPLDVVMDVQ